MSNVTKNPEDPRVSLASDRTHMANFRTQLALDRTTLAWVRTALAMTSFGFGMVAFSRTLRQENPDAATIRLHQDAIKMGTALVVMGIVSTSLAGAIHWINWRRLQRGQVPALKHWPLSVTLALLFGLLGIVGLWALFAR